MTLLFHEDRRLQELKEQALRVQEHFREIARSANAKVRGLEQAQEATPTKKPEEKN
jgi:hypothetical protein